MSSLSEPTLSGLLAGYGYWVVFGLVAAESSGLLLPGETALLSAAIYAGTTKRIDIILVIMAGASGAILGDNIGFWIGREAGFRLLLRFGRHLGFDESKLKLGQYLFLRHGGKIVFFGRFVAVLRAFAAVLAGVNCMPWPRFLAFNAAGGVLWATSYGAGGYFFGRAMHRLAGPVEIAVFALASAALIGGFIFFRRHESRLRTEAELALPGPLASRPRRRAAR